MKRLAGGIMIVLGLTVMSAASAEKAGWEDKNSDGKVTLEEFLALRKINAERAGRNFDSKYNEKLFADKDINGDGFLTGDEVTASPKKAQ
jgi:Ca2+-binding EF-hand superfamily protein